VALARSLFHKGALLTAVMAFEIAATTSSSNWGSSSRC